MTPSHPPVYVDGRVRVCRRLCSTCIFRPGNRMHLQPGRVEAMVAQATADDSTIVCHQSLGEPAGAVCRGFFERHATAPLQIADRLGFVDYVDPA